MADFNGTPGNDVFQNSGGTGTLTFVLSGTTADNGIPPVVNILVNGAVVLGSITVSADHTTGATQTISVAVPVTATSVAIEYTNDTQIDYTTGDRNVYLSSISLNGTALSPTDASYARTQNGNPFDTIQGQSSMLWGGTMTFSGPTVQNAAAVGGAATNDNFNGGAGLDTVIYSGAHTDFSIVRTSATTFAISHGAERDNLNSIERLQFSDGVKHALDMDGNAGTVAKMIGALFGQGSLGAMDFVGVGLHLIDSGSSASQMANLAVNTSQFQTVAGSFSNADFVHTVANNLGYTGDVSGFISQLDSGSTTKAALVLLAMDTSFNAAHLVGVMQAGIDFV